MYLKRVRFDCHGHNAPAYGCNHPGDMSGEYLQAADAEHIIAELYKALILARGYVGGCAESTMRPHEIADLETIDKAMKEFRDACNA